VGLVKTLFTIVAAVVLILVGIAAYLYFTDYAAHATVTGKGSDAQGDYVVVTPALLPTWHYTYHFSSDQDKYAPFVCTGYDVAFHVQTHQMQVRDATGRIVYDSNAQPDYAQLVANALRCNG
jgi:hypothetical protein